MVLLPVRLLLVEWEWANICWLSNNWVENNLDRLGYTRSVSGEIRYLVWVRYILIAKKWFLFDQRQKKCKWWTKPNSYQWKLSFHCWYENLQNHSEPDSRVIKIYPWHDKLTISYWFNLTCLFTGLRIMTATRILWDLRLSWTTSYWLIGHWAICGLQAADAIPS